MTQESKNVAQFPSSDPPTTATSGGNGGGNGRRLTAIEARLARLEAHLQHIATREDIEKLRADIAEGQNNTLKWLVGIIAAAGITLAAAVMRLFI